MISRNLLNKRAYVFCSLQPKYFITKLKKFLCLNENINLTKIKCFSSFPQTETVSLSDSVTKKNSISYHDESNHFVCGKKVFIEVYGCQMNHSDAEIVNSVLTKSGYLLADNINDSDVVLLMTCSIREGAEQKIWNRLNFLSEIKRSKAKKRNENFQIGILGCMAERLKTKIMETNKNVDLICGPDAYRSLPRLLYDSSNGQAAANVLLSLDETYADIQPIRRNLQSPSAYISIMRGCNNMCTYCVVPFTRGRERSRPLPSIVEEARRLVDQGVRDITLLGQNVNSYNDKSAPETFHSMSPLSRSGFKTVYKTKPSHTGVYKFVDLLDRVSMVDKEVRVRFTSPHPKDFPDEMLQLMAERPNLCKHIHIPAQSGSDVVLERMGRGYGRHLYMQVVNAIKSTLPGVCLSSDFIAGFCGETEQDHLDTLSLLQEVKYNMAYCFPYSIREKTRAYHRLDDNVPHDVKVRRTTELVGVFRRNAEEVNASLVGSLQLVLVEGVSRRSVDFLSGRSDGNIKVILPKYLQNASGVDEEIKAGDYVAVKVHSSSSQVLKGAPLYKTNITQFYSHNNNNDDVVNNINNNSEVNNVT